MQRTFHYSLESTNCTDSLFRYASCRHLCPRCLKPVLVALQLRVSIFHPSCLKSSSCCEVGPEFWCSPLCYVCLTLPQACLQVSSAAHGRCCGGFRAIGAGASKRLESRDLELKLIVWPLPTFIWSKWWPLPSVFEIHILDLWGRERWNATKCPDVGLPLKLNQYHDAHWWIGGTQWNFSIICKPAARVSGRRCIYPIQSDQPAAYCCLVSRSPMFWYFSVEGWLRGFSIDIIWYWIFVTVVFNIMTFQQGSWLRCIQRCGAQAYYGDCWELAQKGGMEAIVNTPGAHSRWSQGGTPKWPFRGGTCCSKVVCKSESRWNPRMI